MKISDYSRVSGLVGNNIFLLDGPDGTKTILASDLAKALLGLPTSTELVAPLKMGELDQAETVLKTNSILIGTDAGNKAVAASVLAQKLIGMLTSAELVNGLKLSELTKTTELAATDYIMAGLAAGNRAMTAKDLALALPALLTSAQFISPLKMGELPQMTALTATDNILIGTADGNKYMKAQDALYAMLDAFGPPEIHRSIFRGKYLGASVSEAQKAAIQDGTFKDLFVGDYWTINGVNWQIADMDYFLRCGDTDFTKHHLVIVPDTSLYNAQMNTSNTTEGGYIGSQMYKENLNQAKTTIANAFGNLVLAHKDYLTNAVSNGYPSAGAWVESTAELMNEIMVYGTHVYAPANNGTTIPNKYTTGKQQFALFVLDPKKVNIRVTYWLRDVVSSADFADVGNGGFAGYGGASGSFGVRPYFCVGS